VLQLDLARMLASERCRIGSPSAAGVVTTRREVAVLEPWSLLRRQDRYGVVPVRTQIAGVLPEDHALEIDARGVALASYYSDAHLVRRGTRWTVRPNETLRIWKDGAPLQGIAELNDGDALTLESGAARADCVFVAKELDRVCRS
jgi:hypothetical protein